MSEDRKNLEIVTGDGDLDISPVYEHLNAGKPKCDNHTVKNIVIPKVKKDKEKGNKKQNKENE